MSAAVGKIWKTRIKPAKFVSQKKQKDIFVRFPIRQIFICHKNSRTTSPLGYLRGWQNLHAVILPYSAQTNILMKKTR